MKVADFHCDLLSYLALGRGRGVFDPESQASVPFLKKGGVTIQTFPIFTMTGKDSVELGTRQFEIYGNLARIAPDFFGPCLTPKLSIENASSFCLEDEPIEKGLFRLESWWKKFPIVYISLTWNSENRFGGGAHTNVGLKEDGKRLLRWMSGKNIAVDLSHASDLLAQQILEEIKSLQITPIASHSNFRAVYSHVRNLPDSVAKEIVRQGGVIGLNLVRHFLGSHGAKDLISHIKHAEMLGIQNHLCLGADFFSELDVEAERVHLKPYFFDGFSTSACYPQVQQILLTTFSKEYIEALMYDRLAMFLELL